MAPILDGVRFALRLALLCASGCFVPRSAPPSGQPPDNPRSLLSYMYHTTMSTQTRCFESPCRFLFSSVMQLVPFSRVMCSIRGSLLGGRGLRVQKFGQLIILGMKMVPALLILECAYESSHEPLPRSYFSFASLKTCVCALSSIIEHTLELTGIRDNTRIY